MLLVTGQTFYTKVLRRIVFIHISIQNCSIESNELIFGVQASKYFLTSDVEGCQTCDMVRARGHPPQPPAAGGRAPGSDSPGRKKSTKRPRRQKIFIFF